jgi:hypothetical protein
MNAISLKRTGSSPIAFDGEPIAEADGRILGGREHNRYHKLALYRTAAGRHVLAIQYLTHWQGEFDNAEVHHADDAQAVLAALMSYDPLMHVAGYPPGETYAEKQRRLEDDICRRYRATVTELYDGLPADWSERIE